MGRKNTRGVLLLTMVLAIALFAGCGKKEEPAGTGSSAKSESSVAETESKAESKSESSSAETESKAESSAAETESKAESSSAKTESKAESSAAETESKAESASSAEEEASSASSSSEASDAVAGAGEYAPAQSVGSEDMVPVTADELVDGTYEIEVDSSSSMFKIVHCDLTVENGEMWAEMTMGGKGYLYLFMGTGAEAASADESDYIPFEELESGEHMFRVPVEALNKEIDCSAFSKKKEKWYDRVLVFLADNLPAEANAAA